MGHTPLWAFMYEPELPTDISEARELLESYSKIPRDEIDDHLHLIRDKAWEILRYPCVGRWRFLYLTSPGDQTFQLVLSRLKEPNSGDALLDLGCCMGQVLRQLAFHGVELARLYGSDLSQEFINIGYELFKDREAFSSQFFTGDVLEPDDANLRGLNGKVSIVHAQSFFHLFSLQQQLVVAQRIIRFFKPKIRNAMLYGRHIGSIQPGEMRTGRRNWYLHDEASFQRLWDEAGAKTRTKWRVEVKHVAKVPIEIPGIGNDARISQYTIYQIA